MIRYWLFSLVILATGAGSLVSAAEPSSRTFDAKGVKIHYLLAGSGSPVVLIHGLYSSAETNWKLPGTLAELAKNHQVIALDLPGHGKSDKPEGDEAYGTQLVEDVVLLLDHLEIKQAHVVGYSLGGMVTMKLIVEHPERVLSGTLGGMGWLKEGSGLQKLWERIPGRDGSRTPSSFVKNVGKLAVTENDVKQIRVPVKVIVGDRDPVDRLYVQPLKAIRPDWPIVEIESAGHLNCIMKPQFREAIAE